MRELSTEELLEVGGAGDCGPSLGGFIYYIFTDCILCRGGQQFC